MRQHSPQPFIKHTLPIWPACLMSLCPCQCHCCPVSALLPALSTPSPSPSIHLQVVAGVGAETPNYNYMFLRSRWLELYTQLKFLHKQAERFKSSDGGETDGKMWEKLTFGAQFWCLTSRQVELLEYSIGNLLAPNKFVLAGGMQQLRWYLCRSGGKVWLLYSFCTQLLPFL